MRLLECFSRRGLSCLLIAGAFGIAPPVIAQPILVGDVARADLQKPPFTEWFDPQYSGYQPVAETVEPRHLADPGDAPLVDRDRAVLD